MTKLTNKLRNKILAAIEEAFEEGYILHTFTQKQQSPEYISAYVGESGQCCVKGILGVKFFGFERTEGSSFCAVEQDVAKAIGIDTAAFGALEAGFEGDSYEGEWAVFGKEIRETYCTS